jgi:hypothetical protein
MSSDKSDIPLTIQPTNSITNPFVLSSDDSSQLKSDQNGSEVLSPIVIKNDNSNDGCQICLDCLKCCAMTLEVFYCCCLFIECLGQCK